MSVQTITYAEQQFMRDNFFSTIHILSGKPPAWNSEPLMDEYDDDAHESPWSRLRDELITRRDDALLDNNVVYAEQLRLEIIAGDKLNYALQQEKL